MEEKHMVADVDKRVVVGKVGELVIVVEGGMKLVVEVTIVVGDAKKLFRQVEKRKDYEQEPRVLPPPPEQQEQQKQLQSPDTHQLLGRYQPQLNLAKHVRGGWFAMETR